ncbi:hypothetical protein EGW08_018295 [Elysia chlorotica]|uniref:Uncharacterized protein n=1 Tax=Elysia chlorotica TaxID=188477 RepID=A0A3S1B387_ELYCH|nr:hypothetical protein EGW08_018295 [Elysia chlorotica]
MYEESPSCVGNYSVLYLIMDNEMLCNNRLNISLGNDTDPAICGPFKELRNCVGDFYRGLCGDLYAWFNDRLWLAVAEVFFLQCVSDLESDQTPVPPIPASYQLY